MRGAVERIDRSGLNEPAEHLGRYAFCINWVKDKTVLDAACGEGYGANLLASYAHSVTGIDIDLPTITAASQSYRRPNIRFVQADVLQLPFSNHSFDVVVSFETLEHVEEHEQMMSEVKRVLKPAGLLVISTPDKHLYSDKKNHENPFHKKELYLPAFQQLINHYFLDSQFYGQQHFAGSVIHPLQTDILKNIEHYSGNFNQVKIEPLFSEAVYLLAVASDGRLPDEKTLLFNGSDLIRKIKDDYENTWSYKIGRFITRPYRVIVNSMKAKK